MCVKYEMATILLLPVVILGRDQVLDPQRRRLR